VIQGHGTKMASRSTPDLDHTFAGFLALEVPQPLCFDAQGAINGGLVAGGRVERRLAAVLAADVAGYSRLMGADEVGTLATLKSIRREIVDPAITEHKGRIVKTTGDGLLVEFASAVDAVTCATVVQDQIAKRDIEPRISFRIGINIGDIILDGDDIFGDGVNVAARLGAVAEPGGICISRTVRERQ
jgi:adenylate cyclase